MKKEKIVKLLYVIAILCYLAYFITKNSQCMFWGGIFLIIASSMAIVERIKNSKEQDSNDGNLKK